MVSLTSVFRCPKGTSLGDCLATFSSFDVRVNEVKEELTRTYRPGYPLHNVMEVIVTSDETDPSWWDDVRALGYRLLDHSKTVERYGEWLVASILASLDD